MVSPFEQGADLKNEMKAEHAFKKLYRELSKLVHDDKFNGFTHEEFKDEFERNASLKEKYEKLSKESAELIKMINTIKGGNFANGGQYKGRNLNSFTEKLEALKEAGVDISSFSSRFEGFLKEANEYKTQSDVGAGQRTNQTGPRPTSTGEPRATDQTGENMSDDEKKKAQAEFDRFSENANDEQHSHGYNEEDKYAGYKNTQGGSEQEPKTETNAEAGAEKTDQGNVANEEKIKEREENIKNLTEEMEAARKEYATADCKQNTALSRIRKFFSKDATSRTRAQYNTNRDKDEQDQDLAYLRAQYDNKRWDLYKLQLEEAKEKGATDAELVALNKAFGKESNITMELEYDNAHIEQQADTFKGAVGKKMVEISKSYQKMHWTKKIAIAGICFSAGALAAPAGLLGAGILAGTSAASGIGVLLALRRTVSGALAGVGTSLYLEKRGQDKKQRTIDKEGQEFLEKMKSMSEEEKYEFLKGNAEKAVKDQDNLINKIKNQDIRQLATGTAFGAFIGSGLMADLFHGITEHFGGHGGVDNIHHQSLKPGVAGAEFPERPTHGMFAGADNMHTGEPAGGANAPIDYSNSEAPFYQQVAGVAPPSQFEYTPSGSSGDALTIHQGSSIEKTLIEHLRGQGVKNPGHEAHKMFLNYMRDNKESIIQKVGDGEYHKMLKDGMVNVKAGTGLNIVMENGELKLHDITGNISHIEHPDLSHVDAGNVDTSHIDGSGVTAEDAVVDQDITNEMHNSSADIQSEMNNMNEIPANGTPRMLDFDSDFANSDLHGLLVEKSILDNPYTKDSVVEIKNHIFGKSAKIFSALKGENISEIMKSTEAKEAFLSKIPRGGKAFFNELVKQVPPKSGDTTLKWIVRVAVEAKKIKG